jgi:carbamoyltransferase
MLVMGLSGGPDSVRENLFGFPTSYAHDSACALIKDGAVLCAIEEERLNRIKHTNKFPYQATMACLREAGAELKDVDLVAYYSTAAALNYDLKMLYLKNAQAPVLLDEYTFFQRLFKKHFNHEVEQNRFRFVHHHQAHAMSAFAQSGYEESLIVTLDGEGNRSSGMALRGKGSDLTLLSNFPTSKSLGLFYVKVIAYLGYQASDEYKVMGLAPYGEPERFRNLFRSFYSILDDGDYVIHDEKIHSLYQYLQPRRKWEPFTQAHKDIAAALQEALEEIALHLIRHYQQATKEKNLCLAGGVAHNCTLNGKILSSGLFQNIFVQPASHDAGCALGAALHSYYSAHSKAAKPERIKHVYWGKNIGDNHDIDSKLNRWRNFLAVSYKENIIESTAELLASDKVVGWVQGRSEFGPRALGNRSILADPRPAANKDRINQMVKKRESYRPFAPSILEEEVGDYFEIPQGVSDFSFMVFVVKVQSAKRALLGAVTHIDGTARIQTVSRESNKKFWDLISAFKARSGVPILLNTSFNNHAEPIVDSVDDAVVCYLTTELDYLVIGDYLIQKKRIDWKAYLTLKPALPDYISLHHVRTTLPPSQEKNQLSLRNSYNPGFQLEINDKMYKALMLANGNKSVEEIIEECGGAEKIEPRGFVTELIELWTQRLLLLLP